MKSIVLILLCAALYIHSQPREAQARELGPETLEFQTSKGRVIFHHREHQQRNPDCLTCHHQGEGTRCRGCHDQGAVVNGRIAPVFSKAAHKRCGGCHDAYMARSKPAGPGTNHCTGCHQKPESP